MESPCRHTYASTFEGPQLCRPWQLAWRADFGCSGFFEPETACLIVELMLVEGHLGFKLEVSSRVGCQCLQWHCLSRVISLVAVVFIDMRMMTDPDLPGWEKISTTRLPQEFLDDPYEELCCLPDAGCVLPYLMSPSA